jgi:hypothetical protein
MQKVESSSLFIRSTEGPGNGAFFMPSDEDGNGIVGPPELGTNS